MTRVVFTDASRRRLLAWAYNRQAEKLGWRDGKATPAWAAWTLLLYACEHDADLAASAVHVTVCDGGRLFGHRTAIATTPWTGARFVRLCWPWEAFDGCRLQVDAEDVVERLTGPGGILRARMLAVRINNDAHGSDGTIWRQDA